MKERLHYIDWLRVIAFMTLILFHSALPFVEHYNWEINSSESSVWLTRIIRWVHQWRLPLLFFISGVGVRFSLKKRSILAFVGERFVRLFIPLVFAIFFITPFQVYFEWMQEGKISMPFSAFYPSVYQLKLYPEGAITWSHMWFVAYLFVFTLLLLPVFSMAKIKWLERFKTSLNSAFKSPIVHLSLALPFVYFFYSLFIKWPEQGSLVDDWFVFISSITFYLFGFFLGSIKTFWDTCLKYRRLFLTITLVLGVVLIWKYYWNWYLLRPRTQSMDLYLYGFLDGFHIWTLILAAIGYAMKYLNFKNKVLTYLNTAVYPFFILHQAVIVSAGYYVLQWQIGIASKFILLVIICVTSIGVLYHFLIRKTKVSRVFFGMRWNQKIK